MTKKKVVGRVLYLQEIHRKSTGNEQVSLRSSPATIDASSTPPQSDQGTQSSGALDATSSPDQSAPADTSTSTDPQQNTQTPSVDSTPVTLSDPSTSTPQADAPQPSQ